MEGKGIGLQSAGGGLRVITRVWGRTRCRGAGSVDCKSSRQLSVYIVNERWCREGCST